MFYKLKFLEASFDLSVAGGVKLQHYMHITEVFFFFPAISTMINNQDLQDLKFLNCYTFFDAVLFCIFTSIQEYLYSLIKK